MSLPIHTSILQTYCDQHHKLLAFIGKMTDAHLHWLPQTHGNSIAWNVWHLARWADGMQAIIPGMTPELRRRLGQRVQIWDSEKLATRWGFQPDQLGFTETGMGMADDVARTLNFPSKTVLLAYAHAAFAAVEEAVAAIDEEQFGALEQVQSSTEAIWGEGTVGDAIFVHVIHDIRHVGMIECLYGMQMGSGTLTQ